MELFESILRWGFSIIGACAGIGFCAWLVYEGIDDIRLRHQGHYCFSYVGGFFAILVGLTLLFVFGAAFCYINPPIAHLIGLN